MWCVCDPVPFGGNDVGGWGAWGREGLCWQIRATCTGCRWPASARAPARSPSPAGGDGSLGGGA